MLNIFTCTKDVKIRCIGSGTRLLILVILNFPYAFSRVFFVKFVRYLITQVTFYLLSFARFVDVSSSQLLLKSDMVKLMTFKF